jgi:tryptophan synthase alpha chain
VDIPYVLQTVSERTFQTPIVLMGYLNPFLAYGLQAFVTDAARAGVSGLIVPDLPLEESEEFLSLAHQAGLSVIQLVSPATPEARIPRLAAASSGFLYAVTSTGVTGASIDPARVCHYLDRVRKASAIPVCAGFGIRTREHVQQLAPHTDGVIVGSELLRAIERGENPGAFLAGLRVVV